MAERQFGPYRLVRQIAVGGMAEIHLAKTKGIAGFEKYCALKMIHPNFAEDEQFIQMLVDEAKIAVQLTHGNIAQTFDLGRVGETYYITMEYVDGADLYKILRRASEQDREMPLDVCAFIAKEIASALDHAHRKRDNFGKSLGIVHRDVSPQNVLISYAGEVKLVDFGIAKATMKARQTAVGVIKGKYYYMSPEQAWGDPIDARSDIFSAGIVLYEMLTGQMMYLEEDLHKLLEMARKADIPPPSRVRRGIPPQLERIVMRALAKDLNERYQSAGDFASDLERFLHAYAPVFTASKIAALMRGVIGDPVQVPVVPSVEIRDGVHSTHQLETSDLVHERDEIRDENSVIFRLDPQGRPVAQRTPAPVPVVAPVAVAPAPKVTRAADPLPLPPRVSGPMKIPSIAPPRASTAPITGAPPVNAPSAPVVPRAPMIAPGAPRNAPKTASRPRQLDEETRQLGSAPPGPYDDSGLLTTEGQKIPLATWDATSTQPGDDLDNIGERTMVTGPSGALAGLSGFMLDHDDQVEATVVTQMPPVDDRHARADTEDEPDEDAPTHAGRPEGTATDDDVLAAAGEPVTDNDDGPTLARDFRRPSRAGKAAPPPALAAKNPTPAISELRRPKPSRRTPPGGSPYAQPNVLHQIVAAQGAEPMPSPRAPPGAQTQTHAAANEATLPAQLPLVAPASVDMHASAGGMYLHDASGMPLGAPSAGPNYGQGPLGYPMAPPGFTSHSGYPPPGHPAHPGQQGHPSHVGYPGPLPQAAQTVSPGALYPFNPYGQPQQPLSLTGQLRAFEVDEIPSMYKLGAARRRWFAYVVAGLIAVSVAAATTFFIIRTTRDAAPTMGSLHIESIPPGADVVFDGTRMTDKTPLTLEGIPVGSRHEVRIELARHRAFVETVDIPKSGGEVPLVALLKPVTGKIVVNSQPGGAEIWINDQLRGRTPTTLNDIDMGSATKLELRLKEHRPHQQALVWPASGQIDLDVKLAR